MSNSFRSRLSRHGQSLAEYALVLTVVVLAAVGMQVYLKRSLQAKVKDVADSATDALRASGIPNIPLQYEPYYSPETTTPLVTTQKSSGTEAFAAGGTFTRNIGQDETTRTGTTKSGVNLTADDAWN